MNRTMKTMLLAGLALALLLVLGAGAVLAQGPGGGGMIGGWGNGGMMDGWGTGQRGGAPVTMDQAIAAAQKFVDGYGNADLKLTEIMEFSNNFYVQVTEKSTGIHAFELLMQRNGGGVRPEPGPNMMWNTKYGHMGRMWRQPAGAMTVTNAQAVLAAQAWLDANQPGATAEATAGPYYGYYTLDFSKDGKIAGMLSVNGYSGGVWYHTWHGAFVSEREL